MDSQIASQRKVGPPLSIGILFMPYVFSWLTLKDGYTKKARVLSFAWMLVVLVVVGQNAEKQESRSASQSNVSTAQTGSSGKQQRPQMPSSEVTEMCTKLAMHAMAYGNSKYYGKGYGHLFENVTDVINEYPPVMREMSEILGREWLIRWIGPAPKRWSCSRLHAQFLP